ncbi:MAG TPA: hypothetical protein VEI01_17255 [Terriglobales bacterium]|nr:hypothetical protein [Terriglobales bacterium]
MIEEIGRVRAEIVSGDHPAMEWHGNPELMLLIGLAVQGDKPAVIGVAQLVSGPDTVTNGRGW